jgi:hypothetical protein
MHRYVICGIWSVAIVAGFAAATADQPKPTTAPMKITHLITDKDSGFKLNYPIDWHQFVVKSDPSIKALIRPTTDPDIDIRVMVNATRYKPDQVKKITDNVEKAIKAANATLVSDDETTLGGVAARKVVFDKPARDGKPAFRQVDVFAIANDRQYAITFTAPKDQFEKFTAAGVDDVIASFEFIAIPGATPPATRPVAAATSRFTDKTGGFLLDHPTDWTEYKFPVENGVALLKLAAPGLDDAEINVTVSGAHPGDHPLKILGDKWIRIEGDFGAKVASDEAVTIDGADARKICFAVPPEKPDKATLIDWITYRDGREIAVRFSCKGETCATDLPVAEAVVRSFRWTAKPTTAPT